MRNRLLKPVSCLVLVAFVLLDFTVTSVSARMVDTQTALAATQNLDRQKVADFLSRDEVREALVLQGIDPREAEARIGSLTDQEVAEIAGRIDNLPAGGDAVGAIVGAAVFVFLVLLVTDLLGLTQVYPFVRHNR